MAGSSEKNHILWLDSIKGIACWLVVIYHFQDDYFYVPFLNRLFDKSKILFFLTRGTFALNIFFIIASFIAAKVLLENKDKIAELTGKGIIKRYFRLSLPIFLMNLIILFCQFIGIGSDRIYGMFQHKFTLWDVFRDAFFDCVFRYDTYFNSVTWMIYEIFFGYLLTCLICLIIKDMKEIYKFLILSVTVVVMWFYACDYTAFLFGILLYLIYTSDSIKKINKVLSNILGACLIVVGALVASYDGEIAYRLSMFLPERPFSIPWVYDWLAAILFMTGIVLCTVVIKGLDNKVLSLSGRICFPVFIFHRVCEATLGEMGYRYFETQDKISLATDASFIITIIGTIIISLLYVFFVEPYFNRFTALIIKLIYKK